VITLVLVSVLSAALSGSQQHDHAAMMKSAEGAPTSLTAEQVAQLLAGDGMGLAKPAELNRYPGPKHVLELATKLDLSPEQTERVTAIRASMLESARRLGARIVEGERALDAAFGSGGMTDTRLRELTSDLARLQGELRAAHLRAHLETRAALRPEQVAAYDALRGYSK
jgi:Spy/CpxP family protein refolding chaperone